jgi:hypothetical protein
MNILDLISVSVEKFADKLAVVAPAQPGLT